MFLGMFLSTSRINFMAQALNFKMVIKNQLSIKRSLWSLRKPLCTWAQLLQFPINFLLALVVDLNFFFFFNLLACYCLFFFFFKSAFAIYRSAMEVMLLRRELHWAKEASFFDVFVQQILAEHPQYTWHLCKGWRHSHKSEKRFSFS